MSSVGTARELCMYLGTRERDEAIAEVRRLVKRLDDAYDSANYVLKLISGSPGGDPEDVLRIGRKAIEETITLLDRVLDELDLAPVVA